MRRGRGAGGAGGRTHASTVGCTPARSRRAAGRGPARARAGPPTAACRARATTCSCSGGCAGCDGARRGEGEETGRAWARGRGREGGGAGAGKREAGRERGRRKGVPVWAGAAPARQAEPRERRLLLVGKLARPDGLVDEVAAQLLELHAVGQVFPAALGQLVRAAQDAAGGVQHAADALEAQQPLRRRVDVGQERRRGQERCEVVLVLGQRIGRLLARCPLTQPRHFACAHTRRAH